MKEKQVLSEYEFLILFCSKLASRKINIFNMPKLEKRLYEYALDGEYISLFKEIDINHEAERINLTVPAKVFCTVGTLVALSYPEQIVIPFSSDEANITLSRYSDEHKSQVDDIIDGILDRKRLRLINIKCCK